jgi:hypothetical protein
MTAFQTKLKELGACVPARRWVGQQTELYSHDGMHQRNDIAQWAVFSNGCSGSGTGIFDSPESHTACAPPETHFV